MQDFRDGKDGPCPWPVEWHSLTQLSPAHFCILSQFTSGHKAYLGFWVLPFVILFQSGDIDSRKLIVVPWRLCTCGINNGGLGIKNLKILNSAMLGKLAWGILCNYELCFKLMCDRFITANGIPRTTVSFSSIWGSLKHIYMDLRQHSLGLSEKHPLSASGMIIGFFRLLQNRWITLFPNTVSEQTELMIFSATQAGPICLSRISRFVLVFLKSGEAEIQVIAVSVDRQFQASLLSNYITTGCLVLDSKICYSNLFGTRHLLLLTPSSPKGYKFKNSS